MHLDLVNIGLFEDFVDILNNVMNSSLFRLVYLLFLITVFSDSFFLIEIYLSMIIVVRIFLRIALFKEGCFGEFFLLETFKFT